MTNVELFLVDDKIDSRNIQSGITNRSVSIMNRIRKLLAAAGIAATMVLSQGQADAMVVTGISQSMTIADKTVTATDQDGQKIKFVSDGRVMRLMSADGEKDYLSFNSFDGRYTGVDFNVRAIETTDPGMRLFEITATHGANEKNCGYWLVGKHNGLWTTYISWNSLANIGFRVDRWHKLSSRIVDQQLVITSTNSYGRTDFQTQAFWDASCDWFGVRRL